MDEISLTNLLLHYKEKKIHSIINVFFLALFSSISAVSESDGVTKVGPLSVPSFIHKSLTYCEVFLMMVLLHSLTKHYMYK